MAYHFPYLDKRFKGRELIGVAWKESWTPIWVTEKFNLHRMSEKKSKKISYITRFLRSGHEILG